MICAADCDELEAAAPIAAAVRMSDTCPHGSSEDLKTLEHTGHMHVGLGCL
jgi:hypothetical protein